MGTNYYLRQKPCETCGHHDEKKHIGKSSYGWSFHFRGYLDNSIVSFEDWLEEFKDERKEIVNEYGEIFTVKQFKEFVKAKDIPENLNHYNITCGIPQTENEKEYCKSMHNYCSFNSDRKCWKDNNGYAFIGGEFS